jgi:hypothetical protein
VLVQRVLVLVQVLVLVLVLVQLAVLQASVLTMVAVLHLQVVGTRHQQQAPVLVLQEHYLVPVVKR